MNNLLNPIKSAIRSIVPPLLLLCSGFIFCMLWFTLMADTRAAGITTDVVPAPILSSIMTFYQVIFGPMTWLVKIFILVMLLSMTLQLTVTAIPWYIRYLIFVTNSPPVFMAVLYLFPLTDRFVYISHNHV